jgi:hypothetical protein
MSNSLGAFFTDYKPVLPNQRLASTSGTGFQPVRPFFSTLLGTGTADAGHRVPAARPRSLT